jgi:hypothetical protein
MKRQGILPKTGPDAVNPSFGGNSRPSGGGRTRFVGTTHHADLESASLRGDHPAAVDGRTLFPTRVKEIAECDRVLINGRNNAKIGATIEKGPWAGMPVLTLTLEERATCPRTCHHWLSCYGNAMPMPRRHKHGPALVERLAQELGYYADQDRDGFAVRLHILGDFYSEEYVEAWANWMARFPMLHVWGYTARLPSTPIGRMIDAMNCYWPDRWAIRFSVPPDAPLEPMQVTTIWRQPATMTQPEGSVCPQQFNRTATCGTCGLCWNESMDQTRIVFVGHGMNRRGRRST